MRTSIVLGLATLLATRTAAADPPAATRALIRKIARGAIAPADLVDPATGVVFLTYTEGERDPPTTRESTRACGTAAADRIAGMRRRMRMAIELDEIFACRNRPAPRCTIGIGGEFETIWDLELRVTDASTLVLDTVIERNSTYAPKDEAKVLRRLRKRHATTTCDPEP